MKLSNFPLYVKFAKYSIQVKRQFSKTLNLKLMTKRFVDSAFPPECKISKENTSFSSIIRRKTADIKSCYKNYKKFLLISK
jgi:hypothetical protein